MPLDRDITEKIKETFSFEDAPRATELLLEAGKSGRIARCIVFTARGNLDRLKQLIQLADQDFRDVIVAGSSTIPQKSAPVTGCAISAELIRNLNHCDVLADES